MNEEGDVMAQAQRDAVFAWAAGQLSWERRLRELESEAATEPDEPDTGLD
jgi:hypothetical protein